jgi:branched-chain amino acid transport system permease protein
MKTIWIIGKNTYREIIRDRILYSLIIFAFLLIGFDNVVSPILTQKLQKWVGADSTNVLLMFSNWRWIIFGLALILTMRFRPEGLAPSKRMKEELHHKVS